MEAGLVETWCHLCREDFLRLSQNSGNRYNGPSKVHRTYQVGERLTEGFEKLGDYHVIFWNCQLFAKLLLKLICHEPEQINFDIWSTADVARLVRSFTFRLN